jgi:DNA polymerase-3 subunit gamma/tau
MAEPAAYQVVARRYRPQRFDELVGQEHVARGLSGAIESGRIGHAYLFTGARGVGKTSAARIYAKALECVAGPAAEPCNQCNACLAITAGQDVDVVEIDAASNRGVDEIRQLRQNVAVRPARGRFKIYIIDEVHMLTREAFNALLKTLEEPPSHVKFVLCTTEPDKLPITILSRCQRFDFQTVGIPAIAQRLAQIVEAEKAEVDPAALDLIARRAAGSMRDSQSLLEQLLGAAAGPIGVDDVHAVIGTGREEKIGALVAALASRDAPAALAALDAALAGGADPGGVLEQLIAAFRDALLASVGCGSEMLREGEGLGVDLAAVGRQIGTETILAMLQIIDQALARMRTSGHAAVLAEMAIVRLAGLESLDSLAEAIHQVKAAAAATPARPQAAAPVSRPQAPAAEPRLQPPAAATVPQPPREEGLPPREKKTTDRSLNLGDDAESPVPRTAAADTPLSAEPRAVWQKAGEAVGGLAADFAAEATAVNWRGDVLEATVPASAATAVTFLRRPQMAASLAAAAAEIVGRPVKTAVVVDESEAAGASNPPAASSEPSPRRPVASQSTLVREAMEHPFVMHACQVFDAAIRKVEPSRQQLMAPSSSTGGGELEAEAAAQTEEGDG